MADGARFCAQCGAPSTAASPAGPFVPPGSPSGPYLPPAAPPYPPVQPFVPPAYQPYGAWTPTPTKTNGLAIASMVLGIVWVYWIGSILAIVFGHVALSQIKKNPNQTGRGMAIAGVVLGWVEVGLLAMGIVIAVARSN